MGTPPTFSTAATPLPSRIGKVLPWVVIVAALISAYFANVALQSHWGRKAQAATGLPSRSLADAVKIAAPTGQPILLEVSAIWCPSCRHLDQTVMSDPQVRQLLTTQYVFARMDYESPEAESLFQKTNQSGFPLLLLMSPHGQFVRRLPIPARPGELLMALRQ
jgi:thiol:disulfide interchange protein